MFRAQDLLFLTQASKPRRNRCEDPASGNARVAGGLGASNRPKTSKKPPRWEAPGHWIDRDGKW